MHLVTSRRIGVSCYVRNAAALEARWVHRYRNVRRLLIRGQGEHVADAAAAGAAIRAAIPDDFAGQGAVRDGHTRAATGERVRTRCWKVDMGEAIGDSIARSAVARRTAHCHAERRGIFKCLIERRQRLLRPRRLRSSQLIETMAGFRTVSCTAVVIASRKPRSVFGAK